MADRITKSVAYVCATLISVLWISTCDLSVDTIRECNSACTSVNSQMKSVTQRECVCVVDVIADPWVLPRR